MDDIRYKQRFSSYTNALGYLKDAIELKNKRELSYLEKQGLIQSFEFTFELSWKVLKDFLEFKGTKDKIYGSRDAILIANEAGLLKDPHIWLKMIKSRNLTSHIYDETLINDIIKEISDEFLKEFMELQKSMEVL